MKKFQYFGVLTITLFSSINFAFSQCDDDPTVDFSIVSDITLDFSSFGYCPNMMEDVDIADSGELTDNEVSSSNTANPDCDPSNVTITFTDNWLGGCPEVIERTWLVEYATIVGGSGELSHVQLITLNDDVAPSIDTPSPPEDVTISTPCDEQAQEVFNVTGFAFDAGPVSVNESNFPGVYSEDCIVDDNGTTDFITYEDVWVEVGCPDEVGIIERTWTITDECGNSSQDIQMITLLDEEEPTIDICPGNGTPIEISVVFGEDCDGNNPEIEIQSGFPFNTALTMVTESEFNSFGNTFDNCNDGLVDFAEYQDEVIGTGCETGANISFDILRHWTVTDLCGNTSTCDQQIWLMDYEDPMFDAFPDYFYDQGPQGDDGGGQWYVESIFCNYTVDFTSEFMLPDFADIIDNCTMFGDLQIGYNPDIAAGPVDFGEGVNEIIVSITDECNNRFQDSWFIELVCLPCGPDAIYENCMDPPTVCELESIEGFSSCTPEFTTGFGALCSGFSLDNPSYFEFIAGAEDLDFEIIASNCSDGQGIQATITDPCDATTCYTDFDGNLITQGMSATISAVGLTIGNVYQLVVDGWGGDECNWEILSVSALPFDIPDPSSEDQIAELPSFTGCDTEDLIFCQGSTIEFWPDSFEEAMYFFCWSLDNNNGVSSSNGNEDCTEFTALETTGQTFECSDDFSSCGPLELTFEELGEFTLCLTELENGCDNEGPPSYCWEITIIENGPINFGEYRVCQHDLEGGWFPDVEGPNGETWQGDVIFTEGETNNFVLDDCGCEFEHIIDVVLLPEEPETIEVSLCAYLLEDWVDPNLGIDWDDIEDYYQEPINDPPFAFLNPLEEESIQTAYDGIACDTFIYYEFFLYDVPGEIAQDPGPACDVILSLELGSEFPEDLIDIDDLNYTWGYGPTILSTDETVSVIEEGEYDLTIEYFTDTGDLCSFFFEVEVTDFGTAPAPPTFQNAPTQTCITELDGIIYSVPAIPGAEYFWEVSNGDFVENAEGNEITISIIDPTIFTEVCVSLNSACGPSDQTCGMIEVTDPPMVELLPIMDICVDQAVTISANVTGVADEYYWVIPDGNYTQAGSSMAQSLVVSWSMPGTYIVEVSVEDESGCLSNVSMIEVNVLSPLNPPSFSCSLVTSNTVQITFADDPNGSGSTYMVTSGQTATEDNGVLTISGLVPDENVTVVFTTLAGTHPCPDVADEITCTATDCPLNPSIDQPDAICLDGTEAPIQLVESAGNPGGVWSGPGTDDQGNFDPTAAGPGTHQVTYEVTDLVADCTASDNVSIVVYDNPVEDFMVMVDTVCLDEVFNIDFEDSDGKTYAWEFDVDNSNPTTDDSGFGVSYSSPGDKRITMTVSTGPDCDYTVDKFLYVRPQLVFPGVFCEMQSPVSVGFGWDALPGVEMFDYEILLNGEVYETGTQSTTTISVDGLSEGDIVDLTVTAIDTNGCMNDVQLAQCEAQQCPSFDIQLNASELVTCWDPINGISIQLDQITLDEDGNTPVGTGEWGGSPFIDPITGEFVPDGPSADPFILNYTFAQDVTSCPGNATIEISILDTPDSEFAQNLEELCISQELTFTLASNYNPAITYEWTTDYDANSYELIDNGDGTFTVQFFAQGTGDFTLVTSAGDCESMPTTLGVVVEDLPTLPTISCEEDLSYLLFDWEDVDCVDSYIVYLDGESIGSQTDSELELTGLDPNQTVEIEVEIVSDCLCEFPNTIMQICTAQDCEDAEITFDGNIATEYCMSSLPSFTYTADVAGIEIDNSGTFSWSGDGVDASGNVDFTGYEAGIYTINVEYEEDDCFYNNSIDIEILESPEIVLETFNAPCPGALGEVMLNGLGNGPFSFETEEGILAPGSNDLVAGTYNVTITDSNNCISEASFTIGTNVEPVDELSASTGLIYISENNENTVDFDYTVNIENVELITWTINGEIVLIQDCNLESCGNFSYEATETGSYEICAFANYDGANCELVECRALEVDRIIVPGVYIPNVITPENEEDPVNSTLNMYVHGEAVTVLSIGIYDRWGNRVYFDDEEKFVDDGESIILWDAEFPQGIEFNSGVYVYSILTDVDGIKEYMTDDITIVR